MTAEALAAELEYSLGVEQAAALAKDAEQILSAKLEHVAHHEAPQDELLVEAPLP
jgi:hypothetical protein